MQRPEGLIPAIVLLLLDEEPTYGYEIMKKIEEISGGYWCPGQGTVYGTIDRLADQGYIEPVEPEGESADDRNYFGVTQQGKNRIEQEKKMMEEKVNPIDRVLGILHLYRYFCDEDFSKVLEGIKSEFEKPDNA
ncbi:MAG: PadR family transcriptional regulator [Candidatus Bipolaricaulota bacterium]